MAQREECRVRNSLFDVLPEPDDRLLPPMNTECAHEYFNAQGRSRPLVWLCDGNKKAVSYGDELYLKRWRLAVVMSYPVNENHLFAKEGDNSRLCLTLKNMKS